MKQSDYLAQLKSRGLATSNLFLVYFKIPENVYTNNDGRNDLFTLQAAGNEANAEQYLSLYCEEASLPAIQILTGDTKVQSFNVKMPYQKEWTDLTLTFKCDQDMFQKKLFDSWLNRIVSTTSGDLGYKKDYQTDIVISQYKKSLTGMRTKESVETELTGDLIPVYISSLTNAFPISVGEVQYSHSDKDNFIKIQVTFSFEKLFNFRIDGATYINPDSIDNGTNNYITPDEYNPDGLDSTPYSGANPIVGDAPTGIYDESNTQKARSKFPRKSKYSFFQGAPDPVEMAEALLRQELAKRHVSTQFIQTIDKAVRGI